MKLLLLISLLLAPVAASAHPTPLADAARRPERVLALDLQPSLAPDHRSLHIPIAVYLTCAGADISTTMFALGRSPNRLAEGNPLMRGLVTRPALAGVVINAVPVGIYLLAQAHHTHATGRERQFLKYLLYAGGAYHCGIAAHNTRLIRSVSGA